MATLTTNVHHVVSVELERVTFDDFVNTHIKFTTADGSTLTFTAFSAERLELTYAPERSAKPAQTTQAVAA